MSDVWQGPGWWLASDGKWYPADAEPGAVYEGDLSNEPTTVDSAPSAAPEPTPEPVAPVVEVAPAVDTPVAGQTPIAAEPVVEAPEPIAPAPAADPLPPATASFGADPFAQMPAPVVEEPSIGGWQAVAPETPIAQEPAPTPVAPPEPVNVPEPVPAAPPTVAAVTDDDGWTSAFEELQDGVDVNAPTVPEAVVPEVQIPDVQVPTEIPDVQVPTEIPEVQIPDVQVPTEIPEVQIPDVQVPTEIPEVQIPDVQVPTEIPEVAAPAAMAAGSSPLIGAEADGTRPIERDDAWRKPLNTDETTPRAATATRPRVPEVVDLAIPDEPAPYVPEPQGRNWGMIIGLLAALLIICAIAFLIARVFTGGDDVATTDPGDSTTVTEPDDGAAQDSTTAPSTDSTETSAPSTESTDTTPDTTDAGEESEGVSVFALRAGDCIVGDIGAGQVTQVTKVDCEEEHQFEVYREALIESSITTFDEEAISAYAEEVCRTSLEAYIPPDDERGLKFKFLQPTEDSWNQAEDPDRVITCLLFDDDAPLIGRAN